MALHWCRHVPIPPAAATAIVVAGVVTTVSSVAHRYLWRLTWRKGHHCSSASSPQKVRPSFLPPIVCLSSSTLVSSACWKPKAPTFRKRQSRHKGSSGLSASAVENCLSFLLYNAFRCRNGRCGWCAGRNDRSIRVEISGLLAKVLTSTGWLRSVWNSKSKFWTQGKYTDQKQVSSSLPQTSLPMKNRQGPKTRREQWAQANIEHLTKGQNLDEKKETVTVDTEKKKKKEEDKVFVQVQYNARWMTLSKPSR